MADTYWKQTTENENVTAILQSLVGIGYLRPAAKGALLIEDPKRLTAELTAEIARIIHDEYHWQTDGIITPECVDMSGRAAEAIVARLRAAAGEGET